MHPNAQLITDFYAAFSRRDAEGMAACYAPDVAFSDAVFPALVGARARGMWRMLCARGEDLVVVASGIEADDTTGKAHWQATYTFSATGRAVVNEIDATFRFEGGRIVEHTDRFDFPTWARQALGLTGRLLGWTAFLQKKVQSQAGAQLRAYLERHPETPRLQPASSEARSSAVQAPSSV